MSDMISVLAEVTDIANKQATGASTALVASIGRFVNYLFPYTCFKTGLQYVHFLQTKTIFYEFLMSETAN